MAKSENQKLKLLYLMRIFLEKTDEHHGITMEELITSLAVFGVSAERKSIYMDIENLKVYGMDIIGEKRGKQFYYSVGSRQFELAELKLLVDSVQSAKFITAKKSEELIGKLESLASHYEASQLQRQVYVTERVKTMNESIYYNVDKIHAAISRNAGIRFQYYQWNVDKQMEFRKNGAFYEISPWALVWDDENYYMVGFDSEAGMMKHYRVDKMRGIDLSEQPRQGREEFAKFDMAVYTKKRFGMFGGKECRVKLEASNELAGVILDRFGQEVMMIRQKNQKFHVSVDVAVSSQFLAWVIALGDSVKIISPPEVVQQMREEIGRLAAQYCQ